MTDPASPPTAASDPAEIYERFHANRGAAIQAYTGVEQSLCELFANLSGMTMDVAATIFFRISSSRVRDTIVEKLLKKKHHGNHSEFWNSFAKLLDQVAQKRNEIVHWNTAKLIGDDGKFSLRLMPPNYHSYRADTDFIDYDKMSGFIDKCDVVARACRMFTVILNPWMQIGWTEEQRQTWLGIFQQAFPYPLPNTHPLFRNPSTPETQPPASPASLPPTEP